MTMNAVGIIILLGFIGFIAWRIIEAKKNRKTGGGSAGITGKYDGPPKNRP